jgi:hypothetical protein
VTIIALIKLPLVSIGVRLDVRTDDHTRCIEKEHPLRAISDRASTGPGLAKCRSIQTRELAVVV